MKVHTMVIIVSSFGRQTWQREAANNEKIVATPAASEPKERHGATNRPKILVAKHHPEVGIFGRGTTLLRIHREFGTILSPQIHMYV